MKQRRNTTSLTAPASVIPCLPERRNKLAFAEWLDRERVAPKALAAELGITVSYVYQLKCGSLSPGAKLRIRIHHRSNGEVPFDSW